MRFPDSFLFVPFFPRQKEHLEFKRFGAVHHSRHGGAVRVFFFLDETARVPHRFRAFSLGRFATDPHPNPVQSVIQYENVLKTKQHDDCKRKGDFAGELASESKSVCFKGPVLISVTRYLPL